VLNGDRIGLRFVFGTGFGHRRLHPRA
jgi:hypothetical protein